MDDPAVPESPERKAERLGLSFYVDGPFLYVFDGGSRGYDDSEEWSACGRASRRTATEEEIEMWGLL